MFKQALLAAAAVGVVSVALAAPVSVSRPFFNLEYRGPNSLGWGDGEFVRFGANGVTPVLTNSFPADYTLGTVGWVTKDGVDPATWSRRIWPDPLPINATTSRAAISPTTRSSAATSRCTSEARRTCCSPSSTGRST